MALISAGSTSLELSPPAGLHVRIGGALSVGGLNSNLVGSLGLF